MKLSLGAHFIFTLYFWLGKLGGLLLCFHAFTKSSSSFFADCGIIYHLMEKTLLLLIWCCFLFSVCKSDRIIIFCYCYHCYLVHCCATWLNLKMIWRIRRSHENHVKSFNCTRVGFNKQIRKKGNNDRLWTKVNKTNWVDICKHSFFCELYFAK